MTDQSKDDATIEKARKRIGTAMLRASPWGVGETWVALLDIATRRGEELREGKGYLTRLFLHAAPQCTAFEDLPGLATQIDNLLAGRRLDKEKAEAERDTLAEENKKLKELIEEHNQTSCPECYNIEIEKE